MNLTTQQHKIIDYTFLGAAAIAGILGFPSLAVISITLYLISKEVK